MFFFAWYDFHFLFFCSIFDNEEGKYIVTRKDEMINLLQKFEQRIFSEWSNSVPNQITIGLSEFLIQRDDKKLLRLNFVPDLINALNEVKYLKSMEKEDIPARALELFNLSDELWDTRLSLTRVVEWYNQIMVDTNDVEYRIIEEEILEVDKMLQKAITKQTWKKYDKNYVMELYDKVKNFNTRVVRSQKNIQMIRDTIRKFGQIPLYERKDEKSETLLALDDREGRLARRKKNCQEAQGLIDKFMDENFRLLFNHPLVPEVPEEEVDEKESIKSGSKSQLNVDQGPQEKMKPESGSLKLDQESQVGASLTAIPKKQESIYDIVKTDREIELYRPYEEYVDKLVGDELMNAVATRSVFTKQIVFALIK